MNLEYVSCPECGNIQEENKDDPPFECEVCGEWFWEDEE